MNKFFTPEAEIAYLKCKIALLEHKIDIIELWNKTKDEIKSK